MNDCIFFFAFSYDGKNVLKGKTMKDYIEERAVAIANYIIDHNATVRQTAKKFGISKSTVHKDVTDRLEHINPSLAARARIVLDVNKSERHIRGGLATREKYQHRLAICSKQDDCEKGQNQSPPCFLRHGGLPGSSMRFGPPGYFRNTWISLS